MSTILLLGSAPMARQARDWPRAPFDAIVAINNAHAVRPDWDYLVYPYDFPDERLPQPHAHQRLVDETAFVPAQNAFGGFVYAGGTMAFTAAYWALYSLAPKTMAFFGCDMHYPATGPTHFYGTGTADPLRPDITLRSIEAKSARFFVQAAMAGCQVVNLSDGPSRLIFPRANRENLGPWSAPEIALDLAQRAQQIEAELGYFVPSGRYWEEADRFDPAQIDRLDRLWLAAAKAII